MLYSVKAARESGSPLVACRKLRARYVSGRGDLGVAGGIGKADIGRVR